MGETIKNISRREWIHSDNSLDAINAGSLQRIGDATEKMAQRHTELMCERDSFERQANFWRDASARRDRTVASLKGHITKLRKKLDAATARHTEGESDA